VFEVKRKPNESQSTRQGAAAATARDIQPLRPEPGSEGRPDTSVPVLVPVPKDIRNYQIKTPVITGEINYKGTMAVEGVILGQLTANGGSLSLKQKSSSFFALQPELSGDISFRDMLRVNGHVAGTIYSKAGTLIIDNSAEVDANIEVAIANISGTVHGDIVAHERVELGPSAKIYGNIWTRSIAIKDGAIFDGVCTMIEEKRS
jgi:cytoskeletal protein CcmA (bactofilin family)